MSEMMPVNMAPTYHVAQRRAPTAEPPRTRPCPRTPALTDASPPLAPTMAWEKLWPVSGVTIDCAGKEDDGVGPDGPRGGCQELSSIKDGLLGIEGTTEADGEAVARRCAKGACCHGAAPKQGHRGRRAERA